MQARILSFYEESLGKGLGGELSVSQAELFHSRMQMTMPTRVDRHVDAVRIVFSATPGPASICFFGSLVEESTHQFVTILDTTDPVGIHLVTVASMFNDCVALLRDGHTFALADESPLRRVGFDAGLVVTADFWEPFEGRAHMHDDEGGVIEIFAVVPITRAERELKVTQGVQALLDDMDARGREATASSVVV